MPSTKHRAVIYARKSISDRKGDESGSIAEQLRSGRLYAASQDWEVVGEFTDDGVSAGNAPEDRAGWQALLAADGYDRVIVRHVDRVTRSLYDFLTVDKVLQARGASLVAVKQSLDMSSPTGRLLAKVLAIFAEYERELIRERMAGARQDNLREGKAVGGKVTFGWMNVPIDPNDPKRGKVVRHDPDRIDFVREMVRRCRRGDSLYMITSWLNEQAVPPPTWRVPFVMRPWAYTTVERLLRNPILAGATPYNPGNESRQRGEGLLLDHRGLPVVNPTIAIMPLAEWRAMVDQLDNRDSPQSKPRAMKAKTSGLLSGLVWCADESHGDPPRMWRGTTQGRPGYQCRECYQTISNFEDDLIAHFLEMKGDWPRWSKVEQIEESGADVIPEIERRLRELAAKIDAATSSAERKQLREEQDELYDLREEKRKEPGRVVEVWNPSDHYFSELWAMAGDDVAEQRAVLEDALERVLIKRGSRGRRKAGQALDRLQVDWRRPDEVGPRPL